MIFGKCKFQEDCVFGHSVHCGSRETQRLEAENLKLKEQLTKMQTTLRTRDMQVAEAQAMLKEQIGLTFLFFVLK